MGASGNKIGLARIAATSLIAVMALTACSHRADIARPAAVSGGGKVVKLAASAARKAEKALVAKNAAGALVEAEAAVAAVPRDADYRTLLGRSYLAAGRFSSAEVTFQDALTLDPQQGRAALSLALVQIALGKADAARDVIARHEAIISPADRGLALALAGDARGSIDLLESVVRSSQADAQVRQNLALSYALAGRWQEAKLMASYDLAPAMVSQRIMEWAQLARPNSATDQIASLLGVTPVADPGQPVRLALAPEPAPQALAAAEPVKLPVVEAATPIASTAPLAVVKPKAVDFPITFATFDGIQFAPRKEVVQPLPVSRAVVSAPRPAPVVRAAAKAGNFVVQIGAYSQLSQVEPAWNRAASKYPALARFEPSSSIFSQQPGSERFYRLSVGGFGTASEASTLCRKLKEQGASCFVRGVAGDAPLQWASRGRTVVASR